MKTPEEIFDEALQARGIDRIGLQDSEVYEAGLDAIKQALTIPALTIPVVSTRIFRCGDKVEWRGMKLIVVEVGVDEVLIATSENVDDEDYNDWWVRNEDVC